MNSTQGKVSSQTMLWSALLHSKVECLIAQFSKQDLIIECSSLTLCKKEYFCLLFNGFAINVFAGKKLIK